VLKDGRIANVSIHVLPFDTGQGELVGDVAARLAELTATVATDCFLTAQVIGHVSSREVADNETLAAHRLARSRADAVQASLIGGGLPAKAIASVWDWQFLVREPRATLWLFRLIQGEDCEGLPLDGNASELVAANDAPGQAGLAQAAPPAAETPARDVAQAPQQVATAREASTPAAADQPEAAAPASDVAPAEQTTASDLAGVVSSAAAAETTRAEATQVAAAKARSGNGAAPQAEGLDAQPSASAAQAKAPQRVAAPRGGLDGQAGAQAADQTEEVAVPAGPAPDAVPTLTRPLPALSPPQPGKSEVASNDDRSTGSTVAAVEPRATAGQAAPRATADKAAQRTAAVAPQQSAPEPDPERQGKVEWNQDNVVITYATNSSYFPPGTTRRLSSLLETMSAGGRYRVQLEVGVSGSDTVVGASTPDEARRYNRWLAERRLSRVREWLDENAKDRQLEIEPAFQADDSSRRVVVRVAPIS
jgi:hypothetical protein